MAFAVFGSLYRRLWENKKKVIFVVSIAPFAINYGRNKLDERRMFVDYCTTARKYGQEPIPLSRDPRQVTVIVNEETERAKPWKQFNKFALPLLHFSGVKVDIIKWNDSIRDSVKDHLKKSDVLYIVGGNQLINDVVNNIVRFDKVGSESLKVVKVCCKGTQLAFFPCESDCDAGESLVPPMKPKARQYCESAMAVICGIPKQANFLSCQMNGGPPFLAVGSLRLCSGNVASRTLYSYFVKSRLIFSYFRRAILQDFGSNMGLNIQYSDACTGCYVCTNVRSNDKPVNSFWQKLFGFVKHAEQRMLETSKLIIPCGNDQRLLTLETHEVDVCNDLLCEEPKLNLIIRKPITGRWQYFQDSVQRVLADSLRPSDIDDSVQEAVKPHQCKVMVSASQLDDDTVQCNASVDGEHRQWLDTNVQVVRGLFHVLVPAKHMTS